MKMGHNYQDALRDSPDTGFNGFVELATDACAERSYDAAEWTVWQRYGDPPVVKKG